MNTSQLKGAAGEFLAAAALIRNGYQIFFNISFTGYTDLIAEKLGKFYRIQVRTFYERRDGKENKYLTADLRTSKVRGHNRYVGLCDLIALIDCDSGEVFLIDVNLVKNTHIFKGKVLQYKIFPIKS